MSLCTLSHSLRFGGEAKYDELPKSGVCLTLDKIS